MQDIPSFSQRHGYEPLPPRMKREEISKGLRISLWNEINQFLCQHMTENYGIVWQDPEFGLSIRNIFARFKKTTNDDINSEPRSMMPELKSVILLDRFNRVLDLLELLSQVEGLDRAIRNEFEKHGAAWRLRVDDDGQTEFVPCGTNEECEAVLKSLETLHQNGMSASTEQLKQAAEAIREGRYKDSVANSYMALEAVARNVAPTKSSTLGKALKAFAKGDNMSPHLAQAMESLGNFANSQEGVRHSSGEKGNMAVGQNEAVAMFGACACFSSYLCNLRE